VLHYLLYEAILAALLYCSCLACYFTHGIVLKNHGVNHGITLIDDDYKKSHSNNEKATKAYKLFSEGKKPVQERIITSLSI